MVWVTRNKKDIIATNEGRVISIELPQLYIVNAYVPNSGQTLQRLNYRLTKWDKAFGTYLKSLEKVQTPFFLLAI